MLKFIAIFFTLNFYACPKVAEASSLVGGLFLRFCFQNNFYGQFDFECCDTQIFIRLSEIILIILMHSNANYSNLFFARKQILGISVLIVLLLNNWSIKIFLYKIRKYFNTVISLHLNYVSLEYLSKLQLFVKNKSKKAN